jgi:hypothetical protein
VSEFTRLKAARLLAEGRLAVLSADERGAMARVSSDHGTYAVVQDCTGITCDCMARVQCSHALALSMVRENRPW